MNLQQLCRDNEIVRVVAGSRAYGTANINSDFDYRGIFVAPEKFTRTPFFKVEQVELEDEQDSKYYELNHFMKLYVDCNPNILELLWVDEQHVVTSSLLYDTMRENREVLLSKKVAHTFSGYAYSQLQKIKHDMLIMALRDSSDEKQRMRYAQWKADRNTEKRYKEIELGYNPKNAMHLVRLMQMGQEVLETGQVNVLRPNREELLAIRGGSMTACELIDYAEQQDSIIKELYKTSELPHSPDLDLAAKLLMEFQDIYHAEQFKS